MDSKAYTFRAKVWLYPGMAAWHFITVPKKQSHAVKKTFHGMARGFGSLPVSVTIGATAWKTSIFPDTKVGSYLLPIKADVRKREKIAAGQTVPVTLSVRVRF